jgi:hypothetical protein
MVDFLFRHFDPPLSFFLCWTWQTPSRIWSRLKLTHPPINLNLCLTCPGYEPETVSKTRQSPFWKVGLTQRFARWAPSPKMASNHFEFRNNFGRDVTMKQFQKSFRREKKMIWNFDFKLSIALCLGSMYGLLCKPNYHWTVFILIGF